MTETENTSEYTLEEASENTLTGQFLIAMPGLQDPNFAGSLSLICEHSDEGAIALVINNELDIDLADVLEQIGCNVADDLPPAKVLSGGPVSVDRGFVLHRKSDREWQSTMRISSDIQVTTSQDIIDAMASNTAPEGATLILGYAGWAKGQLEQEILDNSWLTVPGDSEIIFNAIPQERVSKATAQAGIDFSKMSVVSGRA